MNMSKLVPIALCALLVACNQSAPEAAPPAAEAAATADAASETVAVYGDAAPVAIKAEQPKAEAGHAHEPGQAEHDH